MQVASKKVYWKNWAPNICAILPLKKIFYQNRCIFKISLKYIKLVTPKTLFVLVLCSFNFWFKIKWPPSLSTKIKISDPLPPPPAKVALPIFSIWRLLLAIIPQKHIVIVNDLLEARSRHSLRKLTQLLWHQNFIDIRIKISLNFFFTLPKISSQFDGFLTSKFPSKSQKVTWSF